MVRRAEAVVVADMKFMSKIVPNACAAVAALFAISVSGVASAPAVAADVSARDVTQGLFTALPGQPANFAKKDLSFLDLADLDFKRASLAGSNLYGVDLTRSRLTGSDLSGAKLDRANIARADFSGANLRGASLLSITAHLTVDPVPGDAPNFSNADLTDSHIAARLDGANFKDANLTRARVGRLVPTWGSYRPRAILNGVNFSGANLTATDFSSAMMRFANFSGAKLLRSNFRDCDLAQADFSGADVSGSDFTGADLNGAKFEGATGLASAVGLNAPKR
jgi:uncharacterized protein YjbI with pentapeptide repeats